MVAEAGFGTPEINVIMLQVLPVAISALRCLHAQLEIYIHNSISNVGIIFLYFFTAFARKWFQDSSHRAHQPGYRNVPVNQIKAHLLLSVFLNLFL